MNILRNIFEILSLFFRNRDTNLKILLSNYLKKNPSGDKKKITHAVYGIVRNELYLKHVIEIYSKKKFSSYSLKTRIMLLAGAYFLLLSSSYPDHAVVNEIVEYSHKREKSFINAILRTVIRNRDNPQLRLENIRSPEIRHSGSSYYIEKASEFSDSSRNMLEYMDSPPLFHIRYNRHKISYEDALKTLRENKIEFKEIRKLDTFEIRSAGKVIKNLVKEGTFYFQNSGSQLISILASEYSRKTVLDCCAAPGSKSVTLSLLNPKVKIVGNDLRFNRIRMLKKFISKFELGNIFPVNSDAEQPPFKNEFDLILLDAPCSSSGTIRKNPDLKLNLSKERVESNCRVQEKLLGSVLKSAPAGSRIIYSVCSFISDESEILVEKVLEKLEKLIPSAKFSSVDIVKFAKDYGFNIKKGKFGLYTLPSYELNNDLFYISLIEKRTI